MSNYDQNEDRLRGTYEFPFEFHHITSSHPRYVMSYHWHVEYEVIRILKGSLLVTLDKKNLQANAGDVIFIHSGILHSGIPDNCVVGYKSLVNKIFKENNCIIAGHPATVVRHDITWKK